MRGRAIGDGGMPATARSSDPRGAGPPACSVAEARFSVASAIARRRSERLLGHLAGALELLLDAPVDLTLLRAHHAASATHPALGDNVQPAHAAHAGGQLLGQVVHEL